MMDIGTTASFVVPRFKYTLWVLPKRGEHSHGRQNLKFPQNLASPRNNSSISHGCGWSQLLLLANYRSFHCNILMQIIISKEEAVCEAILVEVNTMDW
jgi:hypothetical protein